MFESLLEFFQTSPLTIWGPFLVLLLCGLGLPIPEDIVLLAAGALGYIEGRSWLEVTVLMYLGVMLGDSAIFMSGRHLGRRLRSARWFQRYFSEIKQAKVEVMFERYHTTVLFVGRFLPGLRAPIFFTAGSMKVPYLKFLAFDGFAALISVPVFVWLGHWIWETFGADIAQLEKALSRTHAFSLWLAVALLVLVVGFVIYRWRRSGDKDINDIS